MSGVDISKIDPWGDIGGSVLGSSAPTAGGLVDSVIGSLTGNPLGWLNAGSSLISGLVGLKENEQSGAAANGVSQTGLNTSGWVVGEGDANGGTLDTSAGSGGVPWYVWAAGTVLIVAFIKRGK